MKKEKKQRVLFLLYAALFGGIGGHRYYLGPTWVGVVYTLFFWTAVPLLIAFIEIIVYSLMGERDFNEKYNA